ncbi:MAG: fasciclin domain-containing protein [Bacteroidaceae bacterium]|nr:fasciclin domain-containing protein [Bacteroidaceae bacterium]
MKYLSEIRYFAMVISVAVCGFCMQGCAETFEEEPTRTTPDNTIVSYLEANSDVYSEYLTLLSNVMAGESTNISVRELLMESGSFTCFAPTNEAIQNYLQLLADTGVITMPAWNAPEFLEVNEETGKKDFLYEIQRKIVLNSLIEGTAYSCSDFSQSAELGQVLSVANMHGEYLQISCGNGTRYAVQGCDIDDNNSDISTGNGNVHQVHKVINASKESVADMFQNIIRKKQYGYYTYAVLMEACGLCAELDKIEDKVYFQKQLSGELHDLPQHPTFKGSGGPSPKTPGILPERRFFGYTLFLENDAWWEKTLGLSEGTIHTMKPEELVARVASAVVQNGWALSNAGTGTDYTDINNALNQFVTYHIIPAKIEPNKLVIHFNELWYNQSDKIKKASVYDYYTTMGKRRLLKIYEASKTFDGKRNVIYLNRFPILNNATDGDYTEVGCDDGKQGVEIITEGMPDMYNAYIYGIGDVLCYSDRTADNLGNERLRMDVTTLFPELMTNDIRCNENFSFQHQCVGIPQTDNYNYLENCEISSGTNLYYLTGRINNTSSWGNYQGDELNIVGNYEVTIKLPPVPKDGVYELRMGVSANDRRGMCQVYWGTNKNALSPAGMPIDMRMGGKEWYLRGQPSISSTIGWEDDVEDDDEINAEVDKRMRNNWYMKAPNYYYMYGESQSMRHRHQALRRIVLREVMKADETYYVHFRSLLDNAETEFYMDYIELCPKSVFDNPYAPEDIW